MSAPLLETLDGAHQVANLVLEIVAPVLLARVRRDLRGERQGQAAARSAIRQHRRADGGPCCRP